MERMTGYTWFHSAQPSATLRPLSALRGKNDAEQHAFVRAYLSGGADMSASIRRDHIVDPVIGNRRPFAVHLDVVMVANHAALRRATVHEVTAGASAVVPRPSLRSASGSRSTGTCRLSSDP